MSETPDIEIMPFSTEQENYRTISNRIDDTAAILALLEDRDGPGDHVSHTTYELAAGVARQMLESLSAEIDRMDMALREVLDPKAVD